MQIEKEDPEKKISRRICYLWQVFAIVVFLLYFIFAFIKVPYLSLRYKYFSFGYLAESWQLAKYLFAGKISSLIYHQTPKVLISIFLGAAAMTSYEVIIRLPRFLKVMLGFVNAAVTPAASELNAGKKKAYLQQLFIRGLRYQIFFIYPIVPVYKVHKMI